MTLRMAKLDRALTLVHALSDSADGLTLDEMATLLGVNRRTAERLRDVVLTHFDLEERTEERHKRFYIRDSLRRTFTRPSAAELVALQAEIDALVAAGNTLRAEPLRSLLAKVRSGFDAREKRRIDPDMEPLARLQRVVLPAGPSAEVPPETLAAVQGAIMAGCAIEFDYVRDAGAVPQWRRVVPYGLLHGALTYLVGRMPGRDRPPAIYRLDRMTDVRASETPGEPPADWDLDAWLADSFGIWREEAHEVVLRVLPAGLARARGWRFHPQQVVVEAAGTLWVRFRAGGLRELADHLFGWAGELVIEAPEALRAVMRERLALAAGCCGERPDLSQTSGTPTA